MNENSTEKILSEIDKTLVDLYGKEFGQRTFEYLKNKWKSFVKSDDNFDPELPYEQLKGKIFAIAYPDNIYNDDNYTLLTLSTTLSGLFPHIKGIHILPERAMSHNDVWPQDFFHLVDTDLANQIVSTLERLNIIDQNRIITPAYSSHIDSFLQNDLPHLLGDLYNSTKDGIELILDNAFNYHFNDGGFSQKTRAAVDPRFGSNNDLIEITRHYSVMLDYVVNHLDVDNDYLQEFRKGNNDGDAFIIIYRDKYKQLLADRILEKTFRPRPFPLFTGLRKYPVSSLNGEKKTLKMCAAEMNRIFTSNEMAELDERLIIFLSIYFKIENDQGLSSVDKRIFDDFDEYIQEIGKEISSFWLKSEIQTKQKIFNKSVIDSMETFLSSLGLDVKYADLFMNNSDHIFGREFYVYTTFSESQADVNPLSFDGFKMIIDDLFHLLSSGSLSMMRMDAIKYLWKEVGKKNFDMEQGNRLIKVIRLLMKISSPSTLPLDEVNSPDPVVYDMAREGGFAYLFGQVNAVPVAFNTGSLEPLIRFNNTLNEKCPANLLRFVMLSTHDGRSVQGLGVQRTDGHVSIEQFYNLKDTVESRGGKPKFRSVPRGEIAGDTLRKVFIEAGYGNKIEMLNNLFDEELIKSDDLYRLKNQNMNDSDLMEELSISLKVDLKGLSGSSAVDFFIQWIINGRTDYELCCTSRCAFSRTDSSGNTLTPEEEAQRLALAQLFVFTQGQDVPAIYVNDLLGLENDIEGFERSGKPRDLNRHKNKLSEMKELMEEDPFTKVYTRLLNKILNLRTHDEAFYPGSSQYSFTALDNKVFINHPWHNGNHSLIMGNIVNNFSSIIVDCSLIPGFKGTVLTDKISGDVFSAADGKFTIKMKPFGFLWLK